MKATEKEKAIELLRLKDEVEYWTLKIRGISEEADPPLYTYIKGRIALLKISIAKVDSFQGKLL